MAKVFYLGVVERGATGGFGVFFPDLPGCVSAGETLEEAMAGGQEALDLHLDGMREDGLTIPAPTPSTAWDQDEHADLDIETVALFAAEVDLRRDPPKKANVTMNESLLNRIDAVAEAHGMTRSGLLAVAARQWIRQNPPT